MIFPRDHGRRGKHSYWWSSHPGVGSIRLGLRRLTCQEVTAAYRDVRLNALEYILRAERGEFSVMGRKWCRAAGTPNYIGNRHDQKRWTKCLAAAARVASDALLDGRKDLALALLVEHVPLSVAVDWLRPLRLSDLVSISIHPTDARIALAEYDALLLRTGVATPEQIRRVRFSGGPIVGQTAEGLIIDDPYAAEGPLDQNSPEAERARRAWTNALTGIGSNRAGVDPSLREPT